MLWAGVGPSWRGRVCFHFDLCVLRGDPWVGRSGARAVNKMGAM